MYLINKFKNLNEGKEEWVAGGRKSFSYSDGN